MGIELKTKCTHIVLRPWIRQSTSRRGVFCEGVRFMRWWINTCMLSSTWPHTASTVQLLSGCSISISLIFLLSLETIETQKKIFHPIVESYRRVFPKSLTVFPVLKIKVFLRCESSVSVDQFDKNICCDFCALFKKKGPSYE